MTSTFNATELGLIFAVQKVHARVANTPDTDQIGIAVKTPAILWGEKEIKLEATLYKPKGDGPFLRRILRHRTLP